MTEARQDIGAILLGNLNDAYLLVDQDLNIVAFNEPLRTYFLQCYQAEVKVGENIIQCFPKDTRNQEEDRYQRILSGQLEQQEFDDSSTQPNRRYYKASFAPARDKNQIVGVVTCITDISETRRVAETLRLSEQRFRALVQSGADLTAILDKDGVFRYVSPSYKTVLGYEEEDLLNLDAFTYHHPEDRDAIWAAFQRLQTERRVEAPPYRYKRKDGSWAWQRSIGTNLLDDPAIAGMVINTVDLTEIVEAREALSESHKRFEKLVQTSSDSILELDIGTHKFYVSEGFTRSFGHQLPGPEDNRKFMQSLVHPEDRPSMIDSFSKAINDPRVHQRTASFRLRKADGDYARVVNHSVILRDAEGRAYGTLGTLKDNTTEYFYQRLDDIEKDVMALCIRHDSSEESVLSYYLQRLEDICVGIRTSVLRIRENKLVNLCSPSLPKAYIETLDGMKIGPKAGSCGTAAFQGEKVFVANVFEDERWENYRDLARKYDFAACWSEPIFNDKRECVAVFGCYHPDSRMPTALENLAFGRAVRLLSLILARFAYLGEIRKSNERNQYVNLATNDAIYDWDCKADHLYWGEGFERLFGYQAEPDGAFPLARWTNLIHPDDRDEVEQSLQSFLGDPKGDRWESEYRFRQRDGAYTYVGESGYLIRDRFGRPERMIGALRDESAFRLEEIRRQLQQEISRYFSEGVNLKTILQDLLAHLAEFREFDAAEMWLVNSSEQHINLSSTYAADQQCLRFYEESKEIERLGQGEGLPGLIWKHLQVQIWDDIGTKASFIRHEAAQRTGLRAAFGLPVVQHGLCVGVLIFYSRQTIGEDRTRIEPYTGMSEFLGSEIKRKQQEEEMFLLFESAPEIMALASPSGHFSRVNPAFCQLMGYSEGELLSKPFEELLHPDDRNATNGENQENLTGLQANNFINRYRTKSGGYRWISWGSSKPFGEEGHFFAYGRDITNIKELRELLDEANQLARVGGWEWDMKTNTLVWSAITRDIHEADTNCNLDLESGINFYKAGESRDVIRVLIDQAVKYGTPFDQELQILTARGAEKWVRVIGKAESVDGKCVRIYGSVQDVHQQKTAQIDLDKKNRFLAVASSVTGMFLHAENWSSILSDIFELTGEATSVDRICFLQCSEDAVTGEVLASQKIEWVRKPYKPHAPDQRFQNIPVRIAAPEIYAQLVQGQTVGGYLSQLPLGTFRDSLEEFDTRSLLLFPILVDQELYGVLSFDDCKQERDWTEEEVWLLNTISSNMTAAIQRFNIQSALEQAFGERNSILESIGDGFAAIDQDWTVTYWNQQAEELTGVSREQIVGASLWEVFDEIQDSAFYTSYKQVMEARETLSFEEYYANLGKWFDVSAYPADQGISIFFKDATERKEIEAQLRESNERFEKVSEATNDAIWDWNIQIDKLYLGAGFETLFGMEGSRYVALQHRSDPVHPEDRTAMLESLDAAIADQQSSNWQYEYRFQRADGSYAAVIDRGKIIRDQNGTAVRMVGAIQDISERKRHEDALVRLNRQLRRYANQLEASNTELEQFAYIASHDLQEPLRMVSSFLKLLETRYANQLDDNAKEYINFAVDGAVRMKRIILDLLNYSRVGKHDGALEQVNFTELLGEITLFYREALEGTGASLTWGKMPVVQSYRSPLLQVLQNLIGNALKYSRQNVPPDVHVDASDKGDYWEFSVADNGLGIDPKYFDKIFIIFQRLHAKEDYEGTGIGLSVVKKTLEHLGGDIWLESEAGEGSVFYFTLPKAGISKSGPE